MRSHSYSIFSLLQRPTDNSKCADGIGSAKGCDSREYAVVARPPSGLVLKQLLLHAQQQAEGGACGVD